MSIEDILKGTGVVAAVGAASAAALGLGALVTRHPETARNGLRILMQGVQRVGLAAAQTREELGDLWAEAREQLREDLDLAQARWTAGAWASEPAAPSGRHAPAAGPVETVEREAGRKRTTKATKATKAKRAGKAAPAAPAERPRTARQVHARKAGAER